ncbi:MAG: hypothetical protein ACLR5P_07490 [[Eubacterium] siraeum]
MKKNQHLSYMQSADDFRFIIFCLCECSNNRWSNSNSCCSKSG